MARLQEAVRLISSDKAKERSEGIELYKDIFQDPKTLEDRTEGDADGTRWLRTMQALFTCLINDKSACLKRGSWVDAAPISLRRLKESAQMVRWMVERSHTYYHQSAFQSVFNHLTQTLVHRDAVFEPIAVDYFKALRVLLGYQPHMDHLDSESWKAVTSLCFNILLEEDEMGYELDDCSLDDVFAEVPSPSKRPQRASKLLDAEVASCLTLLVTGSNAPLVGSSKWGVHALSKYARFLLGFSTDSTAHLPALQGLNHVLSELEVNESRFLVKFAVKVWTSLLSLWSTKSRPLKEQVLVTLHILLPFVANDAGQAHRVDSLLKKLLDEPDQRFAMQALTPTSFELCCSSDEEAFQYTSLRAGRSFSPADAQAWVTLEVAADCALYWHAHRCGDGEEGKEVDTRASKRRKEAGGGAVPVRPPVDAVGAVIQKACNGRRDHDGKTVQLWALQVLLFVALRFGRHRRREDDGWIKEALPALVQLVGHVDMEIQSWSLLVLAALAPHPVSQGTSRQLWPTVCRRVLQSGTSRTASHAGQAILNSGHLLEKEALSELQTVFDDLEMQGPPYPYDSVCLFLKIALELLCKDIGAAKQKPQERVLAWLMSAWPPPDVFHPKSRSSAEVQDPLDAALLLSAICNLSAVVPWSRVPLRHPSTAVVSRLWQEREVGGIRRFLLTAHLPAEQHKRDSVRLVQHQQAAMRGPEMMEMRCINFIHKGLQSYLLQCRNSALLAAAPEELLRKALDYAIMALLFNGTLQMNHIASQIRLTDLAHELLNTCVEAVGHSNWSNASLANLMVALMPLLGQTMEQPGEHEGDAIQAPGKQSGIQTEVLLGLMGENKDGREEERYDGAMRMIWSSTKVQPFRTGMRHLYASITGTLQGGMRKSAQQEEDDDWVGVKARMDDVPTASGSKDDHDGTLVAHICLSFMINVPHWCGVKSAEQGDIKAYLLEEKWAVSTLLGSGHLLFQAMRNGRLRMEEEELEQVMETIGDDILMVRNYDFNPAAQLLAIDFLDATLTQWSSPSTLSSSISRSMLKLCVFFIRQLNKASLAWKVEARMAAFLEHLLASSFQVDSPLREVRSGVLTQEAIASSLVSLNGRPDMRLRWTAATRTARLYDGWSRLELDPLRLYEETEKVLPKDTSSREQMVTRILLFANVLVASSRVRHVALYHLIEVTLVEDTFNQFAQTSFATSSRLLGFAAVCDLWLLFASQMSWAIAENDLLITRVPHEVVGYKTQMDMLRHTFQPVASMLVAMATEAALSEFRCLVTLSAKTEKEGLLECVPFLTATDLTFLVLSEGEKEVFSKLREEMARRLYANHHLRFQQVDKVISNSLDAILAHILMLFHEPDEQAFLHFLIESNPSCALAMQQVDGLTGSDYHEPCKPSSEGRMVFKSIMAFAGYNKEVLEAATVYSVIHRMTSLIHRERLVGDQLRHLQAFKLYLCLSQTAIEASPAILRLLIHSCAVLLGQVDLVERVWPLLDWTLKAVKVEIDGLSLSVLLILQHAYRYLRSSHCNVQQAGTRLLEKAGKLVLRLGRSKKGHSTAVDATCAWPGKHPPTIAEDGWDDSLPTLTKTLQRTSTMSAPFLDRFVHALERADSHQIQHFCSTTIWIVLDRLRQEGLDAEEQGTVASSLANLLYHCHGEISCPSDAESLVDLATQPALTTVCQIDSTGLQPLQPLKAWLIQKLLGLSRSSDLESAEAAVACLRAVFQSESHLASRTLSNWPALDVEDLRLITAFPALLTLEKKRSRDELEKKEGLEKAQEFSVWILWLSKLLCDLMAEREDCGSLGQLSSLVGNNVSFAREVFAVLVHIYLRSDLSANVDQRHDTIALSRHLLAVLHQQQTDKTVWKAIIQVIVQLRHDLPGNKPLDCDRWIRDVDFLLLQRRATECHLYATALLFAELEREHGGKGQEEDIEARLALQYEIYSNIEDPDSFYGISNPDVRDSLVNRLQHEGQWDRLFEFAAARHEGSNSSLDSIAISLSRQGFNRLSLQVDEQQALAYGAAWQTEKWDLPLPRLGPGTSQTLFSALRAVNREREETVIKDAIDQAFRVEYSGLAGANVEANKAARGTVMDLLGLREAQEWQRGTVKQWDKLSDRFDFDDIERLLSVRLCLVRSQRRRLEAAQLGDIPDQGTAEVGQRECSLLLALSHEARRASKLQIAVNAITQAQRLTRQGQRQAVEEEFASLLWDLGDHAIAIEALARVVGTLKSDEVGNANSLPLALARLGHWRATARSHQPQAIQAECFQPAVALLSASTLSTKERASVHYRYATFAHEQYRTLLLSPERGHLLNFIRHRREEIEQLNVQLAKANVKTMHHDKLKRAKEQAIKVMDLDQAKLDEYEGSKKRFRAEATHMYASTLAITDDSDDRAIVRLISLWFENAGDEELNGELRVWLQDVPSRKLLPFVHQISSRLSGSASTTTASCGSFRSNVYDTVFRMGLDHPFHSLYALYALTRADDAKEGRNQGSAVGKAGGRLSRESVPTTLLDRKAAAADIIARVKTKSRRPKQIQEWEQLCDACVEWARFNLPVQMPDSFGPKAFGAKAKTTKSFPIDAGFRLAITKLRNVQVPVITGHLAVDWTCQYNDFVSIARYQNHFSVAGGVHLPKIIDCVGSDGKMYRQLFKDKDDLRQDAVMQQVFRLLNGLLSTDREAQKRLLRVRTYAVIPLGPRYGLLEFVGNTSPIQVPLLATHEKYRKRGELDPLEARKRIQLFQTKTRAEQATNFSRICQLLPPTFRFHFLELHRVPLALLTNRLRYTRSMATTSIVGHVLGLGDRHVSNILLDNKTGEVVHIDFGVAFDQGKLLPIPELVPFRLTRDLVDAMGLHGVEGVFRRCCQETLRVLREGASVIETVLQVFKYDPLFDWTQNPVKVVRAQAQQSSQEASSSTVGNNSRRVHMQHQRASGGGGGGGGGGERDVAESHAERAIGTVMHKLSTSLSVEYTVNDLMMQARDEANLGSIFHGWQAAL